jgi:hypothetical protein
LKSGVRVVDSLLESIMKFYCGLMMLVFAFAATNAQGQTERLTGVVLEQADDGTFHPIIGANVYWLGTGSGTTTDTVGMFRLAVLWSRTSDFLLTHWSLSNNGKSR